MTIQSLLASPFLIALAINVAVAGDYSTAVNEQRRCEVMGDIGREFFLRKTTLGMNLEQLKTAKRQGKMPEEAITGLVMIRVIAGQADIRSEKDAYMAAWAYCMDNPRR